MTNEQALEILRFAVGGFVGGSRVAMDVEKATHHFAALIARNAELKADARRYRWLRNDSQLCAVSGGRGIGLPNYQTTEADRRALDAAIDAARGAA